MSENHCQTGASTLNEGNGATQFWSFSAPLDLIITAWKLEDCGNMPCQGFLLLL